MSKGLDDSLDDLFALPLAEFTAARNALAAKLAKGGDREAASAVKGLPKPAVSAWAVNRLVRQHAPAVRAMLALGEKARAAQAKALAGGSADALRDRVAELRDALLDLRSRTASILKDEGHAAGDDTLERVATTLRTASQSPEAADLVLQGRLSEDLDPLGVAVLSASRPALRAAERPRRSRAAEPEEAPRESVRERLKRIAEESRSPQPARGKAATKARASAAERAGERERRSEEAKRRREEERAEAAARRSKEAEIQRLRVALREADAEDAKAKAAVEAARDALKAAQIALGKAEEERDDTLAAARRAREQLDAATD